MHAAVARCGGAHTGNPPRYNMEMTILHARVRNGRVVVDEPTDLPDGARVDLLLLDAAAEMDDTERASIEASISRGIAQADRGDVFSVESVIERLRKV
jgi:hypothetical protein